MFLSAIESRNLARLYGLLAEDLRQQEVRERAGAVLLDLLQADYFASFVWDATVGRFADGVAINMQADSLARYDAYFQFHDPITFKLQARRRPTLVTQVITQRELMGSEFFGDFLARDGLHWGVNMYCYADQRSLGDVRLWRARGRDNFDAHTLELLRLVEPAFAGALMRASGASTLSSVTPEAMAFSQLSQREFATAQLVAQGFTDKQIAQQLRVELSTVRTYLQRAMAKLRVARRGALAAQVSQRLD